MSDPRPPAAPPPEPPPDHAEDAALTSLLTALPRTPAPAGFRDAVLAAIAADEADAESATDDSADLIQPTDAPRIAPAAVPAPPSRWRRAAGVIAGLALTAAALSGVAVLWSWSAGERTAAVAVNGAAVESPAAPSWMEKAEGPLSFNAAPEAAPLSEAAPADFADAELAEMRDADRDGVGLPADGALPDASLAAASPRTVPEALLAETSDLSAVRVVRVQSPSAVSNQLAVLQFEQTASRNAIRPRPVEPER
ncbi:hypothetical protein ACG2DA_20175, partial [Alienimonas sp. DA493]